MTYVGHPASASSQAENPGRATVKDVVAAYVGLTKPRVIELLLLTTVPVMFFAARGVPDLDTVPDDDPEIQGYAIYSYLSALLDELVHALER